MKLLQRRRRPKVTALAAQEDMEGLVSAAGFQDLGRNSEGEVFDRGAEIRTQAVLALGELGHEAGNGSLTEALRDPSDDVRSAAVRVLFQRGEVAPLAHALSWLPADSGNSRALALRALLELKKAGTAQLVIRALVWAPGDHPLPDLDVALVHTLVQADSRADVADEAVKVLLTALSEDRAEVVARAEELLQRLAPASVQGLIAELEGGGSPERAAALLGRIADNRALQPLIDALGHRELSVRLHAASALGQLRQPAAVEPLLRATRDNSRDVRAEAGRALDSLGTAAVVIGMSTMVRPLIAEAVASAVDQHGLADRGPAHIEPPPRQLGVGGFRSALEEARTAAEQSR